MDELAFVIVSGAPGSGKSTLARQLAARLGLPLFSKDTIKEALMSALGVPNVEASRRLGAASIETLLALAKANGRGILESNWRASVSKGDLRGLPGTTIEVFCRCDHELSRRRYWHRAVQRHPGHFDALRIGDESLWLGDASEPVAGGWPVLVEDTSVQVHVEAVCAQISTIISNQGDAAD